MGRHPRRVFRIPAAEAALEGKQASAAAIDAAAEAVAKNLPPAADLHADESYRRDVAATLTRRMLRAACARKPSQPAARWWTTLLSRKAATPFTCSMLLPPVQPHPWPSGRRLRKWPQRILN